MTRNTARVLFVISLVILIITNGLFRNMGIYVDEVNTTPSIVSGGTFWLYMDWLRLILSFILTMSLGVLVVSIRKKEK